jgi:D-beta-D-heptose 7-phosphate kinase / D-beta-D-heptose 1-phosphate adenosyltransferase
MSLSIDQLLIEISTRRVLCLGDLMLDRFVYGDVRRISPEAPIPIMRRREARLMLGAVGNVARNVTSLGGYAVLLGVVGSDAEGRQLAELVGEDPRIEGDLVPVRGRRTTLKTRYVADGQQLLRVDVEDTDPLPETAELALIDAIKDELPHVHCVLISDYAKGALTPEILKTTIEGARALSIPVVADPKGRDFSKYRGVSLLKPNANELSLALDMPCETDAEIEQALTLALTRFDVDAILVTRSAKGMSYKRKGEETHHLRARPQEVFDVSGAGDTSLAAIGLSYAAGAELSVVANFALSASAVAVSKMGTAVVLAEEVAQMQRSLTGPADPVDKILSLAQLKEKANSWRKRGLRIGFTNGCFDILHAGHATLLHQAKGRCDRLVLGLNGDGSVRRLKGAGRPMNTVQDRARVLAATEAVDIVVVFDEDTPLKLIEALLPDVLIKGGDYTPDTVVGADIVTANGGEIYIAPLLDGRSTTALIEKASAKAPGIGQKT